MRVAVLVGGTSAEREVSLATGRGIVGALSANGHEVVAIDTGKGLRLEGDRALERLEGAGGGDGGGRDSTLPASNGALPTLADTESHLRELRPDVVFIALHGGSGEDGHLQALLDLVGVPYTGSGHLGSALAMDKQITKELLVHAGVPTPPWRVGPADPAEIGESLGYPVVVKPACEGSTVGVSVVREPDELGAAVEEAMAFRGPVLIERFVPGREIAVGVLGAEALPAVEIRPSHEIYDYECKYTKGLSEYEVPAPLSEGLTRELQLLALKVHGILRLSAYSRIDFRLDDSDRPWCLEANSLPGMTETSLLPKAAAARGISFSELCERILGLAGRTGRARAGSPIPG